MLGPGVLGPGVLGPAVLGPGAPGPAVLGPAVLGPGVLGPAVLGPAVLGPAVLDRRSGLCRYSMTIRPPIQVAVATPNNASRAAISVPADPRFVCTCASTPCRSRR